LGDRLCRAGAWCFAMCTTMPNGNADHAIRGTGAFRKAWRLSLSLRIPHVGSPTLSAAK
jgi:hypothetical protein